MEAKFERCKACGLIMIVGKWEVCPACNVKRSAFEPFTETVDLKRKQILSMHLHPITVHFPQAISVILLGCVLTQLLFPSMMGNKFTVTMEVMAYLLPLSIPPSFISGMIDGYIRFKTINTPYMVQKIYAGIILFIATVAIGVLTMKMGAKEAVVYNTILLVITLACQVFLGRLGILLMYTILPGRLASRKKKKAAV